MLNHSAIGNWKSEIQDSARGENRTPDQPRMLSGLLYPGAKERKLNASHSVSTRTDVNRSLFACRFGKVRLQVLFGTTQCGHEAHPAMLAHCADPAFLMNVAPSGKREHRAGFRIPLRRKKK